MSALRLYGSAILLTAIVLVLPALWYLSPYVYASNLVGAVAAGDAVTVGRLMSSDYHVRLAGLEMSEGLRRGLNSIESGDKQRKARLLSAIKDVFAVGVANGSISPDAWTKILQGQGIISSEVLPAETRLKMTATPDLRYGSGMDAFRVEFRMKPTGEYATLVMTRDGWFRWRATDIELSSITMLIPIKL